MRMMLKIMVPTEAGNHAIKDGSLPRLLEATMNKLKPEAAYFIAEDGHRTALIFFDLKDASDIPSIAEPLFMGLHAKIEVQPAMNGDDLKKGLAALGNAI